MASGAESPRQKMINLMYLVFIAMLALNMSKEVLTTFGEIEREIDKSSKNIKSTNEAALLFMKSSAKNDSIQWFAPYQTVNDIATLGNELISFIDDVKIDIKMRENKEKRKINGEIPAEIGDYERMDNSKDYDEKFFESGTSSGYTETGDKFIKLMTDFRSLSKIAINDSEIAISKNDSLRRKRWLDKVPGLISVLDDKFNVDDVKVGVADSKVKTWLQFNFEGFPEIATTTKLALIQENTQNIIKTLISDINDVLLGENLSTLQAIVSDVNVFYENSDLQGTISLGKYDETFVATSVKIKNDRGKEQEYKASDVMENGRVVLEKLKLKVGGAGEKKLTGTIDFKRKVEGEDVIISIPIEHTYFVNPPQAIISNVDMNIVYADIENTLKISMPGVSPDNLRIMSPRSVRKGKGANEYTMTGEQGNTKGKVRIIIKDELNDITADPVEFDVVKLPTPIAAFGNGKASMTKGAIQTGVITGSFNNERLDAGLALKVASFNVRIGLKNLGNLKNTQGKFNEKVKNEIQRARKGSTVVISNIRFISSKIDKGTKQLSPKNDIVVTIN
tara:strand:+ start:552 stop:2240 length:1689 start_codon:yes stop_codon:yes gene_type:complete